MSPVGQPFPGVLREESVRTPSEALADRFMK